MAARLVLLLGLSLAASAYRRDSQSGGVGLSLAPRRGSSVPFSRGNKLVKHISHINRVGPLKNGHLSLLGPRRFEITESTEVTFHDEGAVGGVDEIAGELVDPTRPGEYTIKYRSNSRVSETEMTTSGVSRTITVLPRRRSCASCSIPVRDLTALVFGAAENEGPWPDFARLLPAFRTRPPPLRSPPRPGRVPLQMAKPSAQMLGSVAAALLAFFFLSVSSAATAAEGEPRLLKPMKTTRKAGKPISLAPQPQQKRQSPPSAPISVPSVVAEQSATTATTTTATTQQQQQQQQQQQEQEPPPLAGLPPLPPHWRIGISKTKRAAFFYNEVTGASSWTHPALPEVAAAAQPASLAPPQPVPLPPPPPLAALPPFDPMRLAAETALRSVARVVIISKLDGSVIDAGTAFVVRGGAGPSGQPPLLVTAYHVVRRAARDPRGCRVLVAVAASAHEPPAWSLECSLVLGASSEALDTAVLRPVYEVATSPARGLYSCSAPLSPHLGVPLMHAAFAVRRLAPSSAASPALQHGLPLALAGAPLPGRGEELCMVGFPASGHNTVTDRFPRCCGYDDNGALLKLDGLMDRGFSGAPLVNWCGEVVGVSSFSQGSTDRARSAFAMSHLLRRAASSVDLEMV